MKSAFSLDYSKSDAVAGFVEDLWMRRSTEKYPLERQWYQNLAWYMGYQNFIWAGEKLAEPPAPSWRVRMVVNRLQGITRTLAAKLLRPRPEWDVLPATMDAEDIAVADLSKQVLDADWYRLRMPEKLFSAMMWMLTTGNVFLKPYWDPDSGPQLTVPNEFKDDDDLSSGNTEVDIVSPFEILDDGSTCIDDSRWILQSKSQDIELLKAMYPKARLVAETRAGLSSRLLNFLDHIRTLRKEGTTAVAMTPEDRVIVHELWIKPNKHVKQLKNGKMYVIAGGQVLNNNGKGVDFPYQHGQLPYVHMQEIHVPGRFWATSTLEQLMAVQADYNKTKSQLIENRNLMGRPKWMVPRGANIHENALTNAPGEIVEHTPGLAPQVVEPPSLPNYVPAMLDQHRQDMEDISGQHEVSNAEAPGQVRGTGGVTALIEQDEVRIGPVIEDVDRKLELTGRLLLSINAQYIKEERYARIVGSNDELLVFTYIGKQLAGTNADIPGVDYYDVRIRVMKGMPQSRVGQQELLKNLTTMGVLNGEKDRNLILQMIGVGQTEKMLDKSRVHRSRQLLELDTMKGGQYVEPMEWHNHTVHIEVVNDFRNSARWDSLTPEIQDLISQHVKAHEEYIAILAVKPQMMVQKAAMLVASQQGIAGAQGALNQGDSNEGQGQRIRSSSQRNGNDQ